MNALLPRPSPISIAAVLLVTGALFWTMARNISGGALFWFGVIVLWGLAWAGNSALAAVNVASPLARRTIALAVPAVFGITLLFLWELVAKGFHIPLVLLPAPSDIWARLSSSLPILGADFVQTFIRAVVPGWIAGSVAGFVVAIVCDAVPFLKRGLLPLGNLAAALPMVGIAPIMVMWFGFDWQSKMAVVVIMTFFPMLVNAVTGLDAADRLERDLMRSYGAGYWSTLVKLRLPLAMPFVFNALKINSTLALIGAIVAEFFGTPVVGMGFRISVEIGRMNVDMVWATIAVAALAGSMFYGILALIERGLTFWHPSYRSRR